MLSSWFSKRSEFTWPTVCLTRKFPQLSPCFLGMWQHEPNLKHQIKPEARDFQNSGSASIRHYISLATGQKVAKLIASLGLRHIRSLCSPSLPSGFLWDPCHDAASSSDRKTFENAAKGSGLVYCEATSDEESLEWAAKLFLFQIDALCDLDAVYRSFPWACIACLRESSKAATLQSMRMEWEFVRDCIDKLPSQHELYWLFSFTRYQACRDVMIKAEYSVRIHGLGFRAYGLEFRV